MPTNADPASPDATAVPIPRYHCAMCDKFLGSQAHPRPLAGDARPGFARNPGACGGLGALAPHPLSRCVWAPVPLRGAR